MRALEITVTGMSCGHCVRAVTEALTELEGVRVERVAVGAAAVSYDPGTTSPERIVDAVEAAGYAARPTAA